MANTDVKALLRSIPPMEELLNADWAAEFNARMGREQVKTIIAETIDAIRHELSHAAHDAVGDADDGMLPKAPVGELIVSRAMALLKMKSSSTLKPVVNATGVVIHTNLGRAPLAGEALQAVNALAGSYNTLEYSLERGGRGGRNSHVEWLVCCLTGAEAALVVNNNAAAVLLALSAVAAGREVVVSAGELVEIGGSFRIPEILAFSGARMVIVGCTNATRIGDYRDAITENTAVLLKVHPSNFRVEGFTASASREELGELARGRGLVFMEDLGSGLLCQLGVSFARQEPTVRACLEGGAGLVTFSGDKLLGGPQLGVIAGPRVLVEKMRGHQLCRALRVDKMCLAAFEATLRLYLAGRQGEIPVIRMIEMGAGETLRRARGLCRRLKEMGRASKRGDFVVEVVEADGVIGGGAFPTDLLPGFGVGLRCSSHSAEKLAAAFRAADVPVITAIRGEQVILHVRTLLDGEERVIVAAFAGLLGGKGL